MIVQGESIEAGVLRRVLWAVAACDYSIYRLLLYECTTIKRNEGQVL
jgi:hypothetical protein